MAWYDKYLSIYGNPFCEVPRDIVDGTRERLAAMRVIILLSALW